jgi:D-alanyl-D-alanine carboxypeptidase
VEHRTQLERREAIRTRREFLATAAAGVALTAWAPGRRLLPQEERTALPPESEQLVRQYLSEHSIPGLQLAYARGAHVLNVGCFGKANRETDRPVTRESLFRIASCSKAFTSAAIFLLVEAGKLRLDDHVFGPSGILRQFAEEVPHRDWVDAITVHHLLTHTGGGWSNDGNDPMFQEAGLDHEPLIARTLKTHPLQNPPGEKYAYSNFGYCVLGRVIERVSEKRYAEFVRQEVLQSARIRDMTIATVEPAPGEVHYDGEGPYGIPVARMDSHGGWIATAADLTSFLAGLFSPSDDAGAPAILKPESLREMIAGTRANPNYGCGLAVNESGNAWHTGSLPGTMSLMVHTHSGMSWAAVLNGRSATAGAASRLDSMLWQIARSVPEWHV